MTSCEDPGPRDEQVAAYDRLTHPRMPAHVPEPLTVHEHMGAGEHTLTREQYRAEVGR
jgi:hypothetical protein